MTDELSALSRLLTPIGLEDFFLNYWEQKPVHVRREISDYYREVLTVEDLDRYFETQHISPQFLSVLKDNEYCPAEQWTSTEVKIGGKESRTLLDLKKLLELFSSGATIVINNAETAMASLTGLTRALEYEFKFPVQTNIYITPPREQGFPPHFDTHNVFILQIHGSKSWNLYDAPIESPVKNLSLHAFNYEEREPRQTIQMQPGDLLYIPRGTVHCARSEQKTSIHVTIGPMIRHWAALLRVLSQEADKNVEFRRLLPHGMSSPQEKSDFAAAFTQQLQNLLAQVDLPALSQFKFVDEQRMDAKNRFSDMLQLENITKDSIVCRRDHLNYLIKRDDKGIIINFEGQDLFVPLFLEPSMVKIFQERPFSINQIEGIPNEAGKLALVRRFVKAGFLKIISV